MKTKTVKIDQEKNKSIVIYFARKQLSEDIAKNLACNTKSDIYEIEPTVDLKSRGGMFVAWQYQRQKELIPIKNPPMDFDQYNEFYFVCPLTFDRINLPTISFLVYLKPVLKKVHYVFVGNDKHFDRSNITVLNHAANIEEPVSISYIRCNKSYKKIKEEIKIK